MRSSISWEVSMEFDGKVVIVTGAARGIGKATALEFSKQELTWLSSMS